MNFDQWADWYDVYYSNIPEVETSFYVDLAKESGGPVLEIGVGTGRLAIPTASAGVNVVGLDLSQAMLDRADAKLRRYQPLTGVLDLIRADMREFDLCKSFPLVTIPSNTLLLALSQEDQLRTLRCAARHLEPDGRLVFDVFIPGPDLLADRDISPFVWGETVHPDTGNVVVMSAINRTDGATQINRETQIFEEYDGAGRIVRRAELPIDLRYLFPAECHALVEQAGLVAERVHGGFDGQPLSEDSEEMIFICRLAQ